MGAASKLEISGACINSRISIGTLLALLEMNNPQLDVPIELDNTTSCAILTNQLIHKRSKSADMRFSG